MINAVAMPSFAASELTYPAQLVEEYLEAAIQDKATTTVPVTAFWAVQQFIQDATAADRTRLDPVVSAVRYELADSAFRALDHLRRTKKTEHVETRLRDYSRLLTRIESGKLKKMTSSEKQIATSLIQFLQQLRQRGQAESYARMGSCI